MRELFDEIYNSVVNGNHTQAVQQLINLACGEARAECMTYIAVDLEQPGVALQFMRQILFRCNLEEC